VFFYITLSLLFLYDHPLPFHFHNIYFCSLPHPHACNSQSQFFFLSISHLKEAPIIHPSRFSLLLHAIRQRSPGFCSITIPSSTSRLLYLPSHSTVLSLSFSDDVVTSSSSQSLYPPLVCSFSFLSPKFTWGRCLARYLFSTISYVVTRRITAQNPPHCIRYTLHKTLVKHYKLYFFGWDLPYSFCFMLIHGGIKFVV